LVRRGLETTAEHWPPVRRAYRWVHAAARILNNPRGHDAATVRRRLRSLLGAMKRHRHKAGPLAEAVDHFLKVTASYWPGLFHCYDLPDLPRTNNALEQLFGSHRHHQRRATGRHAASPTLVVRGQVQIVAAAATRVSPPTPADLQPVSIPDWHRLRAQLHERQQRRAQRTRFRRDPEAYLSRLEHQLLQPALPA
jgi:hypothetical protein